jgi:integrase
MPRFPKPFFRPSRKLWYIQVAGKQINLGPDRDRAFEQYHAIMAGRSAPRLPAIRENSVLVVQVLDAFLEHCQIQNSPATYQWYRDRLQQFAPTIPRSLRVSELRPFHVQQWVDAHPRWSNGTRRIAIRSVKRAMRWAEEQGLIDKSPIANMRKPPGGRRELVISDEEFRHILEKSRNHEFRDLLIVTWETGCRPQESLRVEARHVDLGNQRWIFPESEAKTGLRVVYLTQRALGITQRLVDCHPRGKLFRNSNGRPWTTEAVNCAFRAVRQRMGKEQMRQCAMKLDAREVRELVCTLRREKVETGCKHAKTEGELLSEARRKLWQKKACVLIPKYSLYALRHSWATHALQRGVDPLTVAILLGHKDPSMLAKVYQHLSLNPAHLRSQLEKAVG